MTRTRKVLNVGGNNKGIQLPPHFANFEHLLLDIDPRGNPDIVCDARRLTELAPSQFDAIYCSHNLEHYYRHDVRNVLAGFLHVLREGGFAQIRVPDMRDLMRVVVETGLDIDDVLYDSPAGPIMVVDVIYGHGVEIERSGQDFYAHKTGFTQKSLSNALRSAGFASALSNLKDMEINTLAFKGEPDDFTRALFRLSR